MKSYLFPFLRVLRAISISLISVRMIAQSSRTQRSSQSLPGGLDERFFDACADPGVNLFQYASGNFTKYYPIPKDRSGFGTGTLIFEHNADQGGLGLPERDYYFRTGEAAEKTRQQYVQHIRNVLRLLGESESEAASDAQRIFQVETSLARSRVWVSLIALTELREPCPT